MFETKTKQAPLTNDVTIVPAGVNGYVVLHFPTKPSGKPSIHSVNETVQANLHPVIAWRLLPDGRLDPLTIVPPPDAASSVRYLVMPNNKIFALNDPAQRWNNYDQFSQYLLQQWRLAQQLPAVEPPKTGFVVSPAAVPSMVANAGFFS